MVRRLEWTTLGLASPTPSTIAAHNAAGAAHALLSLNLGTSAYVVAEREAVVDDLLEFLSSASPSAAPSPAPAPAPTVDDQPLIRFDD